MLKSSSAATYLDVVKDAKAPVTLSDQPHR
jgi:hypothetical protein